MKRWFSALFLLLLAMAAAAPASRAGGSTPVNSYTSEYLGHLGGGETVAYAVNDAGQVAGSSRPAVVGVTSRAFLWSGGVMTDLGTLGGPDSQARALNNAGQVAGWATTGGAGYTVRAFMWDPAAGMRNLGTLGGDASWAYGINDAGQVVGISRTAAGTAHAFLWQNGQMIDLGVPSGFNVSYAFGINADGQVVGYADGTPGPRVFRWTPNVRNGTTGTMTLLHPATSYGLAIDDLGDAAGQTWATDGFSRATVWDAAGAHVLPLLPWASYGAASGLNSEGCVVGQNLYDYYDDFGSYTVSYAVVWDPVQGLRELGQITRGNPWLPQASGINGAGQIAAGEYLLTPSPLPTEPALWVTGTGGKVSLLWTGGAGASSYTLERGASADGPFGTLVANTTAMGYTDTNVQIGTPYYYRVWAVNAYGQVVSNVVQAIPVDPPAAPTGLAASPGDEQVTLTWNAVDTAQYYEVFRSDTPGGPYAPIVSEYGNPVVAYETSFTDEYLQNGRTYYYVVTAVNSAGSSGYSNEASATPQLPPPPAAPTGLSAAAGDARVLLTWNGVTRADFYQVKRSATAGGPYTLLGSTYWPSFEDTGLTNGTRYYYVATAVGRGGESPNSSEVSAVPTPPPTAAPTGLVASAAKKKVSLKWAQSPTPGITQNRIYRSTYRGGPYALRATVSAGTSYSDTSVTSRVTYYYVVTAVSSRGESGYSNEASAKPR